MTHIGSDNWEYFESYFARCFGLLYFMLNSKFEIYADLKTSVVFPALLEIVAFMLLMFLFQIEPRLLPRRVGSPPKMLG